MRNIIKMTLIGGSALAFAAPAFAQAEPEGSGGGFTAPEIVVEARRRDESVQEVPIVVNAVTSESIEKLNLRDFKEITALVPGLQMATNANGIGTTSSVRGVNFDVNASGNNGTIEYYLNDAPMSSGPLFQAMFDIGQIEVLRGPQGTLRGRASPSGSITVTARRPDLDEFGAYAMMTANDLGGFNANAAVGVPVIPGVLAVRAAGLVERGRGNRVESINNTQEPYTRSQAGRISVRFTPTDFLNFEGMYQRIVTHAVQYDQYASFNQYLSSAAASPRLIVPEDRLSTDEAPRDVRQTYNIFTWKASAALLGQQLFYTGSYLRQHFQSYGTTDNANFFVGRDFGQNTDTRSYGSNHEVRLQNEERVAGMFDYVIGYFQAKLNSPTDLTLDTAVRLPTAFGGGIAQIVQTPIARRGNTKEESFFGNLTFHLGEATELSGGLRHIRYHDVASLSVNGNLIAAASSDEKVSRTIYAASLKHRFNENLMAYFSFGTSFRPGNNVVGDYNILRSPLENSFLDLPSETSESYEFGIKTDLLDRRLRFNLSVYQQDFKNYPYRSASGIYFVNYTFVSGTGVVPTVGNFNFVSPVPVRVRGFEAEMAFQMNENLNFGATLAYADGKIRNGTMACNDFNSDGAPDVVTAVPSLATLQAATGANNLSACSGITQRSANSPQWSGNVQAEYTQPVSDGVNAYLRGLFSWYGSAQADPANSYDDYGSYGILNMFAGIRDADGAWEVSLYGKNITNNQTVLTVGNGPALTNYQQLSLTGFTSTGPTFSSASATYSGSYTAVSMVAPREFGITARFAFGSR